ncbi:hypothetical protein [Williamsia deligens]|uniref:Uncharacterized protein n=1 Tax=Williamsia deligens TaxID=321325 RepID=A0ABW3GBY0_9NOCA|nr:hypothetical protein [Williamsia deligens]MCP2192722.1 hypothetical protein [Williamsia deligens]
MTSILGDGPPYSPEVSAAIVWAYTHRRERGGPPGVTPDWVLERWGDDFGSRVLAIIERLQKQADDVEVRIDWATTTLADGQRLVQHHLVDTNPGLSEHAANLIARWLSFQVR